LLRPDALKEQFEKSYGRGIYATGLSGERQAALAELDRLASSLTPELVKRQIEAGLDVVTDGELRRGLFTNSLIDAVDGLEINGATDGESSPAAVYAVPIVTRRLTKSSNPALAEAEALIGLTTYPKKVTFPAASYFYFQMFLEFSPDVYADRDALVDDVVAIQRQLVDDVIAAGVDYIQFDFPVYPMLVDAAAADRVAGLGETPATLLDKALAADAKMVADMPAGVTKALHLCRGNTTRFFAGSVESIAERIFDLPYDRFLFEWDDVEEEGPYDPIRLVSPPKVMVMGLISTRRPVVEDEDDILRQMELATKLLDTSQLALSPQCGFASAWRGHAYGQDVQWRKLELVGRVAERIWGRP
jgi:5-methyltetrahydropteroyltriglutamate--homocysteine methyltransferase